MKEVALLKSEQAFPFIDFMVSAGMPASHYLNQVGLPLSLLDHAKGLIVEQQLWQLLENVSTQEGLHDFGLRVGKEINIEKQLDGMMPRLLAQPTLLGMLQAFSMMVNEESSDATFWLQPSEQQDKHWFCRGGIPGIKTGERDAELYTVMFMIKTARLITGPDWKPSAIRLKTNDLRGLRSSDICDGSAMEAGQATTAIEVPTHVVNPHFFAPLNQVNISERKSKTVPYQPLSSDLISESLQEVLSLYLATGDIDLQHAATLLGVSTRTLQRELTKEATNYAKLIDAIRFNSAISLLKSKSYKLVDIAYDLGYSDPAHFSRAFKRWAGVSPREYRRGLQTEAPGAVTSIAT